ncbi:MAG: TrkH family potassium uptake protein [Bacteroidota bacterium]
MHGLPIIRFTPSRILVLGFASLILIGAFLLTLPFASKDGQSLRFLDALFTATSAVCVTGLVVVDTGSHFSKFGQFIIITLIQIGGLGFMTFSTLVAMILGKKIGLKERVLIQESFNQLTLAGLVKLIRNVLLLTLAFEFLGGVILSIRFLFEYPIDRALAFGFFHSVSSFCNAGFDLFGQVFGPFTSITHYVGDWTVSLTIGGLIILGGLGFPVIIEILKYPQLRRLSLHTKLVIKMTLMLLLSGTIIIFLFEMTNFKTIAGLNWNGKLLGALFQSITPRTAGYNSLDMSQLRIGTWFILIVLMFIGASPSSTGGGIKTTTFGVLLAAVLATINGKEDAEVSERRIAKDLVYKAMTVTMLALSWVAFVTLILSLVEPYTFIQLLFEVVSAFGTVGLTTGITPLLCDTSKILIAITMFIGRLGPLTIMVALAHANQVATQYIEDRVIIG